jgi:hypothetical protein
LCVDCIGPSYTLQRYTERVSKKDHEKLVMRCVTMIDPATGWFEIAEVPDYKAFTVNKAVEIPGLQDTLSPVSFSLTMESNSRKPSLT